MKLTAPEPIEFSFADGRTIVVPPPTTEQIRNVLKLDPVGPEAPRQELQRKIAQAEILLGDQKDVIPTLTIDELSQIMLALWAHASGYDPESQLAIQQLLKKKASGLPAMW